MTLLSPEPFPYMTPSTSRSSVTYRSPSARSMVPAVPSPMVTAPPAGARLRSVLETMASPSRFKSPATVSSPAVINRPSTEIVPPTVRSSGTSRSPLKVNSPVMVRSSRVDRRLAVRPLTKVTLSSKPVGTLTWKEGLTREVAACSTRPRVVLLSFCPLAKVTSDLLLSRGPPTGEERLWLYSTTE